MKNKEIYIKLLNVVDAAGYSSAQLASFTSVQIKNALKNRFNVTDTWIERNKFKLRNAIRSIIDDLKSREELVLVNSIKAKLTKAELDYLRTLLDVGRFAGDTDG